MKNLIKNVFWNNVKYSNEEIKIIIENYAKDFNVYTANLVIDNGNVSFTTYSKISYEALVNKLVKERYSDSEEFAILRKALTEKTNEFYIYNAYVEECKTQAKAFIEERNKALNK